MREWRATKWGDEISLEYGKAIRGYQDVVAPYRVYGTNGPVGYTNIPLAPGPGIILGRKGAYRGVHYSPDPFHVIDTAYYVKPKSSGLNMRWLYYAMTYHNLGQIDDGSPIPSTTRSAVYIRDFEVPPLNEQEAIAQILASLDDKIELNRRMNETLEAMARAIFRDWFVDFGPTRAKAEGRAPYLAAEIWDLFPGALDENKKPVGWYECNLGNELSVLETGKRPRGGVAGISNGIPSVGAESVVKVGVFNFAKTKYVPHAFFEGMSRGGVSEGDVLVYKDGGKPGELHPAVTYVSKGFPFAEFCINEHVFRVRTRSLSQPLLYCLLSTDGAFWQMRELATGVAQPGLNQNAMRSITFTMPDDQQLLHAAGAVIDPMIDACNDNSLNSLALAQTRELLLPKLMSGEFRLTEAEKAVEAAA